MPAAFQTPRMHGFDRRGPDQDYGDRFGSAIGHWGDVLRCGANAARLAAWHDDSKNKIVESPVLPLKFHGPRERARKSARRKFWRFHPTFRGLGNCLLLLLAFSSIAKF